MVKYFMTSMIVAALWLAISPANLAAQEGLGERLGRELDEKLNKLSSEFREGWAKVEQLVDQLGVRGRVYARVHWDKVLTSEPIKIDMEDASVVVLTGQVSDEAARKKAVRLAEDTVGVTRVIDRLEVKPADTARR
jgi:hyperosmotically inducible periplasmic protein